MSADIQVRTNEPPRFRPIARLRELWSHREVLANLARRELKAKYKSSALGVAWSMLNPALYLVVFYVVFTYFLPTGIDDFPVYLLSGLLPWTLFSTGFQAATTSVVGSSNLVTKVPFPHETLPLASIRAQTVNFLYQFLVLVAFLVLFGYPLVHRGTLLLPVALVVLLTFLVAIGLATAAWNVRYRDTGHLVELIVLAWFWSTPIVYPASLVRENLGPTGFQIYLLNPVTNVVLSFQRAVYGGVSQDALDSLPAVGLRWYGFRLLAVFGFSLILLFFTWRMFYRRSGDFAEEL
jgi:ABC-2 type transport system permease protein